MKVTSTISPMTVREPVRPAGARKSFSVQETSGTVEQTATVAAKSVPSGLQRVLERLQDMPVASLTHGQANAMQRIERNIARYRDNHGIADPVTTPTEPAPSDPAVTPTPVETPGTPVAADPAQPPVETPVTTPETPIAPPVAETQAETPIAAPVTEAPTEPQVVAPEATIAAPIAETPAETPVAPIAAEPAPVEVPADTPTSTPAVDAAPVATPQLPPLEAILVESLPPAGSVIDMQA